YLGIIKKYYNKHHNRNIENNIEIDFPSIPLIFFCKNLKKHHLCKKKQMNKTVIKLAIQKKGRLSEKTIELLKNCGIKFISNSSSLKTKAFNFPMEILFLRDDDIPGYVADGVADFGILGMNEIDEKNKNV